MIDRFRGDNFFLSNMYVVENPLITPDGLAVPTSEHYYMSTRFQNKLSRIAVASAMAEVGDSRPYADGLAAKQMAHELIDKGQLHFGTPEERIELMHIAVLTKFAMNPQLAEKLAATGDEMLVEGNTWGDRFWGVDPVGSDNGQNMLGKVLMSVRQQINGVNHESK